MTTTSTRYQQLVASLSDKEYREAFVANQISMGVPLQIKQLREDRGWSQETLGAEMDPPMVQESVWRLESPSKGNVTVKTLLRIAAALDVALIVRFAPFSELLKSTPWLAGTDRSVPEYSKDKGLGFGTDENEAAKVADVVSLMDALRASKKAVTAKAAQGDVSASATRFTLAESKVG